MFNSRIGLLAAIGLLSAACGETAIDPVTLIPGAQHLSFRCVAETDAGVEGPSSVGLPMDGCGCTEWAADGTLRRMGRVECECEALLEDADGTRRLEAVDFVEGQRNPAGICLPALTEDGSWRPLVEGEAPADGACAAECTPRRNGTPRGYVGSADRGEVTPLDIAAGSKGIHDTDPTIPGVTPVFIDDLVSDLESHPDGRFVFTVNSSTGTLGVLCDDDSVTLGSRVELGAGPILEAVVWPAVERAKPVSGPRLAYVSAPQSRQVLELDLDAIDCPTVDDSDIDVVRRIFTLPDDAAPGRMTVSADGSTLFVGHAAEPAVTLFDLETGDVGQTIALSTGRACDDGFLRRVLDATLASETCEDGVDNDGDGQVDFDDSDCEIFGIEAVDRTCAKLSQCADGFDNDEDGLIDGADPDCDPSNAGDIPVAVFVDWEGEIPACINGVDDDADGLVDRADPGCEAESDTLEADVGERCDTEAATVSDCPVCQNGEDDDGDGLIDLLDPGCSDRDAALRYAFEVAPGCADGLDNDLDGFTDYAGGDPDCYAAGDSNEGAASTRVGPTRLAAVTVDVGDGPQRFLFTLDGGGDLMRIDLDGPTPVVKRVRVDADVLSMAVRSLGIDTSLLVIGSDATLRSIDITTPTPVRIESGEEVFAQAGGFTGFYKGFYILREGVAWRVSSPELTSCRAPDVRPEGFEVAPEDAPEGDCELVEDRLEISPPAAGLVFSLDDPPQVATLDPDVGGRRDRLLYPRDARELLVAESNITQFPTSRVSTLTGAPVFRFRDTTARQELVRHPYFCRLDQPNGRAPLGCTPVGFTSDGELESPAATDDRLNHRLDRYEGITVIEPDPRRVPSETFKLAYEATIPGTTSRSGQFGSADPENDVWSMVDYHKDFCRNGVEVGDMLIVDAFVPESTQAAEENRCERFDVATVDVNVLRDPLRYRIVEVGQHYVRLGRADRWRCADGACEPTPSCAVSDCADPEACELGEAGCDGGGEICSAAVGRCMVSNPYADMTAGERGIFARVAPAPEIPPYECAAQFVAYETRVEDAWLLTGTRSGYRHSWVAIDGQCQLSAGRLDAGRIGRAKMGVLFENEFFRFRLGGYQPECGIDIGCANPDQICRDHQCVEPACADDADCDGACLVGVCVPATCKLDADCGALADASCRLTGDEGICAVAAPTRLPTVGLSPARRPYALDVSFEFDVLAGAAFRRLPEAAILPRDMRWLPTDDHLYVVDSALQTVLEFVGMKVFSQQPTEIFRYR